MTREVGKIFGQRHLLLFICMALNAFSLSMAFNIDTENPEIHVFPGKEDNFFGYKVLQYMTAEEKGIMVSAPLLQNGSGGICRLVHNTTDCFIPQESPRVKHFGLSMTKESTQPKFTACSPSLAHGCQDNVYLNSKCYQFNSQFQHNSSFRPAFEECTKKRVDLVFLYDGSESMNPTEFNQNKEFISEIMKSLQNSTFKFAAVQFSTNTTKVFDFNDYQNNRHLEYLMKDKQLQDLTNTYTAIQYVIDNIFDQPNAGADPGATKVLVIITDGNPTESFKHNVIKTCDVKKIIRFVIGVKKVDLEKLKQIASEPKENNTYHISSYNGLEVILEKFEKKIFNIEGYAGSKTTLSAENMINEMSQSGFSATYYKNDLLLGMVGSNNWRGALYELHGSDMTGNKILKPKMEENSYMGYTVATGEKNNEPLYFTGAPRFDHTGQIILFGKRSTNWTVQDMVNGEQIGSYFGAELCVVDIDSDSNTDFLLVGAPMFDHYPEKREGQIYIYSLTSELKLKHVRQVHASSQGRFGTTISSISDVNGDGLRDVAVGAPLENDNKGAVYVYLGDKDRGIRSTFSQSIMAQTIKSQLRFFGQAIDGNIDLNDDGLTDTVIGSYGDVVVLRSNPVLNVDAHLQFQPFELSTDDIDCVINTNMAIPMVNLTACFHVSEATKSKTGPLATGLNISYTLEVDPMRPKSRGFFTETDKDSKKLDSTVLLRKMKTCLNHSVYMPKCVTDTLSPIMIKLNFSQSENKQEAAILNIDSWTKAVVEVPFKKNCRQNDTCIAELEVDFNFTTPTLVVVNQNYFSVTVTLANHGDDSYNTTLTLEYPPGLSFSFMNLVQASRPTSHSCLKGVIDKTECSVNPPVYRSKSTATFNALFRIINIYDWDETISIAITAQSDSHNSTRNQTIDVQYEIDLLVKLHDNTTTYLNFTPEDSGYKELVNVYEVKNMGFKAVPVNVTLTFPTELEYQFAVKNYQVTVLKNKTQCKSIVTSTSSDCASSEHCESINCESFILGEHSTAIFILSAKVAFDNLVQRAKDNSFTKKITGEGAQVQFKSFIKLNYDRQRYVQASTEHTNKSDSTDFTQSKTNVLVEFIIPPDVKMMSVCGGVGGFILLLIIAMVMRKMGCFKSKKPQEDESEKSSEETSNQPNTSVQPNQDVVIASENETTADKSDNTREAEHLMSNSENVNS